MSIFAAGSLKRSAGVVDAIKKQLSLITLKPAKKVVVKFDPFHEKAPATRRFLYNLSKPKVQDSNLNCLIKTEVLSDLSPPTVEVHLAEGGQKFIFKCENLSCLEILQSFNKYITPLAPVEDLSSPIKTKSAKTSHQLSAKKKK